MKVKPDKTRFLRITVLVIALLIAVVLLAVDAIGMRGIFCSFGYRSDCGRSGVIYFPPATSVTAKQHNFHVVVPGIWRSAQPNEESLLRMKLYGLKTIVNLRGSEAIESWERKFAKQLGIQYYHFPLDARKEVPLKTLDAILSVLSDPANQPVLFHCHAGKDRTGMVAAAYKIAHASEAFTDIHREMLMYGYDEPGYPAMMKTLRNWCMANGKTDVAREIELIEELNQRRK
ncbi:MAG TPA: tyrosine-protein phosphatase [Candidatus Omnitrophota bacterium]|nr:MAG: Tyrosine phosphatase family protein [Candidatus Omnitrophica bacterium ADurb.Bin314]HOE69309.1 tyrosine-protein phosphatase [Candidatus Omnitrophota bacterium]HQB93950.1 tyrosine-protein phosphatase [Candidatus Omnitrophota bacterium]